MTETGQEVTISGPRLPYHAAVEERFGIDKGDWRTLTDAIFPKARTPEAVILALSYCKTRKLDIFKRPVHIVPIWDSDQKQLVETIWPGISEIRTTAARTKDYMGKSKPLFGPDITETFSGRVRSGKGWEEVDLNMTYPESCEITVERWVHGVIVAFTEIVFWKEAYGCQQPSKIPNAMWQKRPRGQLAKCAEAAALRCAFPEEVGSDYSAEEMEGQDIGNLQRDENGVYRPATPPKRSDFDKPEEAPEETAEQETVPLYEFVNETGEVVGEFEADAFHDQFVHDYGALTNASAQATLYDNNADQFDQLWKDGHEEVAKALVALKPTHEGADPNILGAG